MEGRVATTVLLLFKLGTLWTNELRQGAAGVHRGRGVDLMSKGRSKITRGCEGDFNRQIKKK